MNFVPGRRSRARARDCRSATIALRRATGSRRSATATCVHRRHPAGVLRGRRAGRRPSSAPRARRSRAEVDVTEWLGNEQYAYMPYEAPDGDRRAAARARARAGQRAAAHPARRRARPDEPDPAGPKAELWFDARADARLRPGDRREPDPRRRSRRRAHPSGQPGPAGPPGGLDGRDGGAARPWPATEDGEPGRAASREGAVGPTAIVGHGVPFPSGPNRGARPVRAA